MYKAHIEVGIRIRNRSYCAKMKHNFEKSKKIRASALNQLKFLDIGLPQNLDSQTKVKLQYYGSKTMASL